jgi:hypothetical protein
MASVLYFKIISKTPGVMKLPIKRTFPDMMDIQRVKIVLMRVRVRSITRQEDVCPEGTILQYELAAR